MQLLTSQKSQSSGRLSLPRDKLLELLPLSCQGMSLPDSRWVAAGTAGAAGAALSHCAQDCPNVSSESPASLEPSHSGQIETASHPGRDPSSSPRLRLDPEKPAVSGDRAARPLGEGSVMGKCRPPSQVSKCVSASCFWFPCLHLIVPSSQSALLSGALCAMRRGPMTPSRVCGAWLPGWQSCVPGKEPGMGTGPRDTL